MLALKFKSKSKTRTASPFDYPQDTSSEVFFFLALLAQVEPEHKNTGAWRSAVR